MQFSPMAVLVCDDEAMARKRVLRLLAEAGHAEHAFEADGPQAARALLEREDIELLLVDIQMPGESGLAFVASLPEPRPAVVFLTAHAEHALAAFDLGATDYLVKPVDADKLQRCLARVAARGLAPVAVRDAAPNPLFALKTRDGAELVRRADLTHATFDGSLVTVYFADNRKVLSELTLAEFEQKVPELLRVHRRALLNLDHVVRLESVASGGYVAHTRAGAAVDVSRQAARELRRRLQLG
jgi:two-component system, LytTR family, response regulator